MLDWFDCIGEMARLPFPMVIWRHGFMFLFCVGALLLQQKWQRVDYEWSSGKNMYQGVIVDVPQERQNISL